MSWIFGVSIGIVPQFLSIDNGEFLLIEAAEDGFTGGGEQLEVALVLKRHLGHACESRFAAPRQKCLLPVEHVELQVTVLGERERAFRAAGRRSCEVVRDPHEAAHGVGIEAPHRDGATCVGVEFQRQLEIRRLQHYEGTFGWESIANAGAPRRIPRLGCRRLGCALCYSQE